LKRKAALLLVSLAAALPLSLGQAVAAPDPIPFCMPDLDGHCRYCEIRFDPASIRCVG
jgi:hypothetical protein